MPPPWGQGHQGPVEPYRLRTPAGWPSLPLVLGEERKAGGRFYPPRTQCGGNVCFRKEKQTKNKTRIKGVQGSGTVGLSLSGGSAGQWPWPEF